MMQKAVELRLEHSDGFDVESKVDRAIEIVVKKLDISEREAKARIAALARKKNLDVETMCEVLIRLEKIINESWFESSSA